MAMELIKENIEYEQLLGEQTVDNMIKEEYVIPDVQPDVKKILMVDAKPKIVSKEVMQNKVYVEGRVKCNVLYLASVEENNEIFNVVYTKDFSTYIDMNGAKPDMSCSLECDIEHMECNIINERKISIEGIVQLKLGVYNKYEFDVIKDVDDLDNIQLLKNPCIIDKVIGNVNGELISKAHIQVPMDKPEIDKILSCDVTVHKGDAKLKEGKVEVEAFTKIKVLYKAAENRELCSLEEDVFISEELDCPNADQFMENSLEFVVDDIEFDIKENDLGENRIVDVEALVKCYVKVMHKEEVDMIEDAYSPSKVLRMDKKGYELNTILGHNINEIIIKENIELENNMPKPVEIIMSTGKISVTDKRIVEDKVIVEGLLNVNVLYKTSDDDKYVATVSEDIPFNCSVEVSGAKIDMECITKAYLENLEASIEAGTIAIKGIARVYARVNYVTHKEFLVDIVTLEDEVVKKKASITIYVVQDGDTLWKIAKRYYTTIEDLININELSSDNIMPGQKLIIPGRAVI